jgi:tRNA(Ile2) C34 agmatinyltransferase TiaS
MEQMRPERCARVFNISSAKCLKCSGMVEHKGKCPDYITHYHKTTAPTTAHEQPARGPRHRRTF